MKIHNKVITDNFHGDGEHYDITLQVLDKAFGYPPGYSKVFPVFSGIMLIENKLNPRNSVRRP